MEKLRKVGIWCWNAKERIILTLMVLLLGFRVYYLVSNSAADDLTTTLRNPGPVPAIEPNRPPAIPPLASPMPVTPLTRNPIFVYTRPSTRGGSSNNSTTNEDSKVQVLRIFPDENGKHKAQISTGSSRKIIPEGDSFESYTLMKIDPDTECCEIYSESSNQTFEVCIK